MKQIDVIALAAIMFTNAIGAYAGTYVNKACFVSIVKNCNENPDTVCERNDVCEAGGPGSCSVCIKDAAVPDMVCLEREGRRCIDDADFVICGDVSQPREVGTCTISGIACICDALQVTGHCNELFYAGCTGDEPYPNP